MFVDMQNKILERLQAKIADVPTYREDDIANVPELRQKSPAITVIYNGFEVISEQPGNYRGAKLRQEWLIVVTAKSAARRGGTEDALDDAGALAGRVIKALLGFQPSPGAYLRLTDAPGPEYDAGYCYLPLAFFVESHVSGDAA